MPCYGGTEAEGEAQAESLETIDLLDKVAATVQGFESEGVQRLSREREQRMMQPKDPNLIVYRMTFGSRVHERLLKPNLTQHPLSSLNASGRIAR